MNDVSALINAARNVERGCDCGYDDRCGRCQAVVELQTALSILDKNRAERETDGSVTELALCEARWLVLKPNQLYRLVPRPGCAACEEQLALVSRPQ
jgi:hypothetical protein